MPNTWKAHSKEVLGYVAPLTKINEEYVASVKIQKMQNVGKNVRQIALVWNQGNDKKPCIKGVATVKVDNKVRKVNYDSCEYADTVVKYYQQQQS